jgi:glycosyltransferase involved in cell wall biosynthesis
MQLLMTTDAIGGVWNYSLELCGAFGAHDIRVALAVLGGPPSNAQREQAGRLSNVTVHESSFRLEWMTDPWEDLARAGEWLLSLEKMTGADVVHLNHLVHADLPWQAPVMTVGHSCVLSWWAAVLGQGASAGPGAEWDEYRSHVTRSLQAASCVVAPTEAALNELDRLYGPFRRAAVVFNARDRRQFTAGHKERMVLSAGRLWDRAKNVGALASVAPRLIAPVFVAGQAQSPDGNTATFSNVTLLGPLDSAALASWYSRAAIYALPARYEPFGLTALEAAMSGCALVLGDIGSLQEVWGPAARYVHPEDHDCLRDTLNELIANDSLRKRSAARAMARARQFTPARQARRYKALYQDLLGQQDHPRWEKPG